MEEKKRSSSGSEWDNEKKRKRMISNRESARRSRMRREQHVKDLNTQILFFTSKKKAMVKRINELWQLYAAVESENKVLRAQRDELSKRLECAEIISRYVSGSMDVVAQEPWLKPWHPHPHPQSMPMITTSAATGTFQF